jgi:hypothetical protein
VKTHLLIYSNGSQRACDWRTAKESTISIEDVDCENCKRTDAYKQAKAEQKRKDVEELKADINGKAIINTCTPKTYKQKIEIEIDVPNRQEFDSSRELGKHTNGNGIDIEIRFKPKVKTGAELVGCLCGVSGVSSELAEKHANELTYIVCIDDFINERYYANCGFFTHAYPVPVEKLDELKVNLFSEVIK